MSEPTQSRPTEPDDAERARTLLAATSSALLSTIALDPPGTPFGSVVAHAGDDAGRPLLCLSDLAEHSRNLAADGRASLLVTDVGVGDPLDRARATLLGVVTRLDGAAAAAALERYRAAHPHAGFTGFHDFRMYRLDVTAVRFVGGFARMSWVDAAAYAAARPDPLLAHRDGILDHMNSDHADALVDISRVLGGQLDAESALMTGVDRYGFDVHVTGPGGAGATARIPFGATADTPGEVRDALVRMARHARPVEE
ncbi:HugZ family protein [Pseudonocardia benzenivorans]|uniref:HugZ family protein n=1 Tax=Pseudonocardia benzenivorans TaxID=228005 RepID=A0ABW3VHC0_9PSEU